MRGRFSDFGVLDFHGFHLGWGVCSFDLDDLLDDVLVDDVLGLGLLVAVNGSLHRGVSGVEDFEVLG